jgi:osmotically-inducible protein OsmY
MGCLASAIVGGLLIVAIVAGIPGSALADSPASLMKRVNAALKADVRLNGANAYTATAGVVVLYGTVFDQKDRTLAEATVHKLRGVKQVVNTLRTETGQWLEEEVRINDTLQINGFEGVAVRVVGPEAYLSGQVKSESEAQRAVRVVSSVSKLQVVNFINVARGPMF